MCLDSLIETDHTITEGYKVFDTTWRHISFIMFPGYTLNNTTYNGDCSVKVPQRRWLNSITTNVGAYKSGFHFYETLEGAQEYANQVGAPWRIMKIKVKEILASGYQCLLESRDSFNKVHVAKQMFILKEVCSSD
jgi:hypothetical protein